MKISMKRNKRSMSVTFSIDRQNKARNEGKDLKLALLAAAKREGGFTPAAVIDELGNIGYEVDEKETRATGCYAKAQIPEQAGPGRSSVTGRARSKRKDL